LHARLGHPGHAEIDIYHATLLDNACDSPTHGGQDTLKNIHQQQSQAMSPPLVITPLDSLIPTPDPTPERRCLYEEMGGDASEGLRDTTQTADILSQQPPIILPLHMENIPLSQPIQKAGHDHDECPAKSQDTTLHACGINADLRESNITVEKRECKPYNAQAMTIDTNNIPMIPFHVSFAIVWDPGGLSEMTGKCLWHRPDWAEGVLSYFPYVLHQSLVYVLCVFLWRCWLGGCVSPRSHD
jgi:hypothetical protein